MTTPQPADATVEPDAYLKRFVHLDQDRVTACAAIAPRIAQLAVSFPLAFAALITRHGPLRARVDAVTAVVDGAPLKEIARIVGLPFCFRLLPPESCPEKLYHHHWSPEADKRLRPLIPMEDHAIYPWLYTLFVVARRSDEEIAIWMAREQCLLMLGRLHPDALQPLLMFAWYSKHYPSIVAMHAKWTPDLGLRSALKRCELWLKHLALFSDFDAKGVTDPWLPETRARRMHIVPLTTPGAILEEATAMENCLMEYGAYVADGACRLFSVRIDGDRVATMRLNLCQRRQALVLTEIRGPRNQPCSAEIVHTVNRIITDYQPRQFSIDLCRPFSKQDNLIRNLTPYFRAMPLTEQPRLARLTIDRLWADYYQLARLVRVQHRSVCP